MKISACMITKNEEKNIARCIESYKDVVSEIIVVDTGSTDRTVEIAESYGAKVYGYEWDNNFAKAKNFALDKVTGDWIVFLDADEFFYENTHRNLPAFLKKLNHKVQGIFCKFYHVNEDDGFHLLTTDFLVRILRNDKKIRFVGEIHEQPRYENKNLRSIYAQEKVIKIYHTGYSFNIIRDKAERNIKPLLERLNNGNADPMTHYYLMDCYYALNNFELAIKHARVVLESGINIYGHNLKPYLMIIESMIGGNHSTQSIITEIEHAIERFPTHPDLYHLLGKVYFNKKMYGKSLEAYQQAIRLGQKYDGIELCKYETGLFEINLHLGILHTFQNNYVLALDYFLKILKEKKNHEAAFDQLIRIIKKEKPEDVIFLLKTIYDENNESDVEFLVTNLSRHRLGLVLFYFHKIWIKKFGREDVTVMYTLLSIGKYEEAFKHFSEAMQTNGGEWAEPFAVISAVMLDDRQSIEKILPTLRPSLQKIVEAYYGRRDVSLTANESEDYTYLLNEFILLDAEPQVRNLISLKYNFNPDISVRIGDVLLNNTAFGRAAQQYKDALNIDDEKAAKYFKLGHAYYKMLDFGGAMNNFRLAFENGYKDNDLDEYLRWIGDQSSDEQVRQAAALLLGENDGVAGEI